MLFRNLFKIITYLILQKFLLAAFQTLAIYVTKFCFAQTGTHQKLVLKDLCSRLLGILQAGCVEDIGVIIRVMLFQLLSVLLTFSV